MGERDWVGLATRGLNTMDRRTLLAEIHINQRRASLSRDDYKKLLAQNFPGATSSAELSENGLKKFLTTMQELPDVK